ncbi:MAG TPA: extradiol ring-cleavage dioxygenase, partial [Dehalococcoidia bacterium]|nr:extradiol ring-cleavage dioxygenase [Dehalococcoidia bacterium]
PSPSPTRCFEIGAATARAFAKSPCRVALVASSSWSHAFLTSKNYYLYPDIESDQKLYKALVEGNYEEWKQRPLSAIEESGQQEMLNWFCLVGAMSELGRKVSESEWIESYVNNSPKCFAYFYP